MSFNSGLGMERSYYAATANPFAPAPRLEDEAHADVVIIGGGFTGLHAALNAAERGFSVILLEAGRIADQGTHEELAARAGYYRSALEAQRMGGTP